MIVCMNVHQQSKRRRRWRRQRGECMHTASKDDVTVFQDPGVSFDCFPVFHHFHRAGICFWRVSWTTRSTFGIVILFLSFFLWSYFSHSKKWANEKLLAVKCTVCTTPTRVPRIQSRNRNGSRVTNLKMLVSGWLPDGKRCTCLCYSKEWVLNTNKRSS